ncbi:MAG: hypothetical protein AB9836_06510 [Aminipila sp.]
MRLTVSLTLAVIMLLGTVFSAQAAEGGVDKTNSTWLVYWDADNALNEAVLHGERFDSLVFFAAFFNHDDTLFYPPELVDLQSTLNIMMADSPKKSYLSIVNDYTLPDGTYSLKSTLLLRRLLQNGTAQSSRLVGDIVQLALSNGYQGIEIDFEGILGDLPLWESFFSFIRNLYSRCHALGLSLRVLLEPRTPFDLLVFPIGPEYVMMCYNLFGYHSGPGPKATKDFLAGMVSKMSVIPESDRTFALALGGYDWSGDKVTQLTVHEAEALMEDYGAVSMRNEEVANFSYIDEDGVRHEVWYGDEVTLAYWSGVLKDLGEDSIDLWRLGEVFAN